jgi:antitoxin MazE
MQVSVRKMGNSQGILIPKPILNQLGLTDVADLQVNGNVIEIRCVKRPAREGWAQDSARLAAAGDDALQWPEFGNRGDTELAW